MSRNTDLPDSVLVDALDHGVSIRECNRPGVMQRWQLWDDQQIWSFHYALADARLSARTLISRLSATHSKQAPKTLVDFAEKGSIQKELT